MKKEKEQFKPAGGILDPILSDKVMDIDQATIETFAKVINNHLKVKSKLIIKNCLTIEVKESARKTRFDFVSKEWIPCQPKKRVSIKFNKKFIDKLLQNI